MNTVTRLRSSPKIPSENRGRLQSQGFTVLNPRFSIRERFDLSNSTQEEFDISLETLNACSASTSLGTTTEDVESGNQNLKRRTFRTLRGVFCPVTLSMFAISIFMRLGFVLAHAGVLQTLLQLGLCFLILLPTQLSVCALATNGAIPGGGIYHMISRALGPEFGGSIGVLFFFAMVIGNGQSVAALVEALVELFGSGSRFNIFHGSHWWRFLYGSIINLLSLITCLFGSSLFSLAAVFIFILVCSMFFTVVLSFIIRKPHLVLIPTLNAYAYHQETLLYNKTNPLYGHYTGFSVDTFRENMHSNYTIDYTTGGTMNFEKIFGILFSTMTGLLVGANMASELKHPNRSIPKGSISALFFSFVIYIVEILLIAATTGRDVLLNYYLFLPDINVWQPLVVIGIIAAVFSACLTSLIGASRVVQALSVDEIFGPVLSWMRTGTTRYGNPIAAVLFTFFLVELVLLIGSMNKIAPIVTIIFLLAYFAVNLSCLALDLASAPNFRPTFVYFSWHTAIIGAVGSIIMCFIVSPALASVAIGILIGLIAILHLRDFPRASWGSISQALIFHQVRKYLLLLDPRKEHVKFWRPQMLLLVANPRSTINLIDVVNDMKKGGLFILGHIKEKTSRQESTDSCAQEYPYWVSLIDDMKIKAFVDITSAPSILEGATQLVRLAGLGGLRPNTVILGFYDDSIPEDQLSSRPFFKRRWLKATTLKKDQNSACDTSNEPPSTFRFGELRRENQSKILDVQSYVHIIEDVLYLNKSICLARNFHRLEKNQIETSKQKVFVDIWPVNFIFPNSSNQFDVTCLYMLQLATILCMVKPWKTRATLRIFLCIDPIRDNRLRIEERFRDLLRQLRINGQLRLVSWESVTRLLSYSSTNTNNSDDSLIRNTFVDINDTYVRAVNELIRQQCDKTSCLYLYLPRPPRDETLYSRYISVLEMLSSDLPAVFFVHGVSYVTCTHL